MLKNNVFLYFLLSTVLFATLLPLRGSAKALDSAYIESFAKTFLEKEIEPPKGGKIYFHVAKIDPRIIIKPCQIPLTANIPENTDRRNVNIKISCEDSTPWQMYLPAKIERKYEVVLATTTISKGETLTKQNIGIKYIASNRIRGERLTNINAVLGSKAEKRISANHTITKRNVCLVCKGDTITIIAKNNNFMIKTKGVALDSGNLHEQISVENSRSGRIIRPKISAVSQVTINL